MTIVTKLPSEAEKKKEAEANEAPLVQVFTCHLIVTCHLICNKVILVIIIRGERGASCPGHRCHHHIDVKVILLIINIIK